MKPPVLLLFYQPKTLEETTVESSAQIVSSILQNNDSIFIKSYREQSVQTKLLDTFLANETPSLTPILSAKNTRRDDRGIECSNR